MQIESVNAKLPLLEKEHMSNNRMWLSSDWPFCLSWRVQPSGRERNNPEGSWTSTGSVNYHFHLFAGLVLKPPLKMAQARVEEQTSTKSRCCIRHSTRSCFPAISSPAGYYSDVMEYSRALQTQRRDRLGAEMQSQWQFKLFCDWSVNPTVWFCHGNGVLEYTVAVLQSAAVDDKIPATKQDISHHSLDEYVAAVTLANGFLRDDQIKTVVCF